MPAATRCRAAAAALGLALLVPIGTVGSAGPAVASVPAEMPAANVPAAGVNVTVASGGRIPRYRIEVRNETNAAVSTTVRQTFPRGAVIRTISNGGRSAPAGMAGTEVTWQLQLPARGAATLRTNLGPFSAVPMAAPACAFVADGTMAYDCATALWGARPGEGPPPWWQQPAGLATVLGALVLLTVAVLGWRILRRRARARAAAGARPPARRARSANRRPPDPPAARPATPPTAPARSHRRPPAPWRVVGGAAVLLLVTVGLVVWLGATQVAALGPTAQSTSGAWIGDTQTGRVGMTMRDTAFEFTVYRLTCDADEPDHRRCTATIGLYNTSDTDQMWYPGMQRAYLPDGNWVTTDEAATRAANQGQDIFAHAIPAGGRLLAPLVFSLPGPATKIQLRSGAFAAGVSVVP